MQVIREQPSEREPLTRVLVRAALALFAAGATMVVGFIISFILTIILMDPLGRPCAQIEDPLLVFGLLFLAALLGGYFGGRLFWRRSARWRTSVCATLALVTGAVFGVSTIAIGWSTWHALTSLTYRWGWDSDTEAVPTEEINKDLKQWTGAELPAGAQDVHVQLNRWLDPFMFLRFRAPPDEAKQFVEKILKEAKNRWPFRAGNGAIPRGVGTPYAHSGWWSPPSDGVWWFAERGGSKCFLLLEKKTGTVFAYYLVH